MPQLPQRKYLHDPWIIPKVFWDGNTTLSEQICLVHHLASKTALPIDQVNTREDGDVFATDYKSLLMDFTRKCKQHAEFVRAAALLSECLGQLLEELLFHAEEPCCPGWHLVSALQWEPLGAWCLQRICCFTFRGGCGLFISQLLLLKFYILQPK